MDAQNISWLVYPDSRIAIALHDSGSDCPTIEVNGNPRGFASLAAAFLWLSSYAEGHEFLSVTALPFVVSHPPLALTIDLALGCDIKTQGRIVRSDKSEQFEWQVDDEQLERIACAIHSIACQPQREYLDVALASSSQAKLVFRLTSFEQ